MLTIDWDNFKAYLNNHLNPKYSYEILRYCKNYQHILLDNKTSDLMSLSTDKRRMVMSSLSNLARFLGKYQDWISLIKNLGLKWSTNDSYNNFKRIFNNDINNIIPWYHSAYNILNSNEQLYLKFLLMSGLRKEEAITSYNLIIKLYNENKLSEYYEEPILQHYKFPELFLRRTKNVYISIIPRDLIMQIATSKPISYHSIRMHLRRNGLKLKLKQFRAYYATYLRNHGILAEYVDILQGRIGSSVFVKHYLKGDLNELSIKVLDCVKSII